MRNSYGWSDRFSTAGGAFAGGVAGFEAVGFPTVKYLRILSRRLAPSPRIASKSSTLLNGPYVLRICKILPAVAGPIPGTCCSCSEVAVLRLTGRSGGFFLVASELWENRRPNKTMERRVPAESGRDAIGNIMYQLDIRSEEHTSELQSRE